MFHTEVQHVSLHAGNFEDLTARGYIWVGLGGGGGGGARLILEEIIFKISFETRNISDRNRRFGASCAIIKVT